MIVARPRPEDPDLGHARALERIEARLGERWGGAWGQQEGSTTVLQIGVVGPTVDDVLAIHGEREGLGQPPTVVSVARSWADLLALLDRVHDLLLRSPSWVSCGPDPRTNTIRIELQQADPALIEQVLTTIPASAISLSIEPGARFIRPGRGSGP